MPDLGMIQCFRSGGSLINHQMAALTARGAERSELQTKQPKKTRTDDPLITVTFSVPVARSPSWPSHQQIRPGGLGRLERVLNISECSWNSVVSPGRLISCKEPSVRMSQPRCWGGALSSE